MSNNNQYAGLKAESAKNTQRCFEMLASAKAMHQDAVVFDATLSDDGEIEVGIFTYDDEPLLQERAQIFLDQPNIRELVASTSGGTVVSVLTDEENMPAWVRTHGIPISRDLGMECDVEEDDNSFCQDVHEYYQYASTRNVRDEYSQVIGTVFGCDKLIGPVTHTEADIEYHFDFLDEETGHCFKIFYGEQLAEYGKYAACPKHVTILVNVEGCEWDESQLREHKPPLLTLVGKQEKQIQEQSTLLYAFGTLWQFHHRDANGTVAWCPMTQIAAAGGADGV